MSRQDANAAFARTSFLYGSNAPYLGELYARYEADPETVDGEWQSFFQSLKDDARDVAKNARGATTHMPAVANANPVTPENADAKRMRPITRPVFQSRPRTPACPATATNAMTAPTKVIAPTQPPTYTIRL